MTRVYIHGRPQGQDVWSSALASNDKGYLKPFLDSRIGEDQNGIMQVDIWQGNSYYSYIHRKNVMEKVNRPSNAYLAITVSFEKQVCTKVETLYCLLEKVYSQLCMNNIIEKVGERERFLVAQLKEKENVLEQVTSVILQNVDKFIASSLAPINNKIGDTTQSTIKPYSTVDVDSPQFLTDCTTNRILVSPAYPSKDKLPLDLKQQIADIESQTQKVERERNSWQAEAKKQQSEKETLIAEQKQLQAEIQTLQQQVVTIKDKLAKEYQEKIKGLQDALEDLQQEQVRLTKDLTQEKRQNEILQNQKNKLQHQVEQLRQGKTECPSVPAATMDLSDIQEQLHKLKKEIRRMAGRFRVSNTTITLVATLFNCGLLIAVVIFYCLGNPKNDQSNISSSGNINKDTIVVQNSQNVSSIPIELMPDYSKARIDIQNLSNKNLEVGKKYILVLEKVGTAQNFQWQVDGKNISLDKNRLIVNEAGDITISCIDSHNYIIKQRKISAQ